MNLEKIFFDLKKKEEAALIIYYPFGFPSIESSVENITIISESGADIIEVGVPFSDPIADGPVIQEASYVALQNGATLERLFSEIERVQIATPLILMSYLNPLYSFGMKRVIKNMKRTKFSGLIIPDLPVEESDGWIKISGRSKIDLIFLLSPVSGQERIKMCAESCSGFIYCVSVTGTTGVRERLSPEIEKFIKSVKSVTSKPVAVGFGISECSQIVSLSSIADGVIIGSRVIESVMKKESLGDVIREFKRSTRRGKGR